MLTEAILRRRCAGLPGKVRAGELGEQNAVGTGPGSRSDRRYLQNGAFLAANKQIDDRRRHVSVPQELQRFLCQLFLSGTQDAGTPFGGRAYLLAPRTVLGASCTRGSLRMRSTLLELAPVRT